MMFSHVALVSLVLVSSTFIGCSGRKTRDVRGANVAGPTVFVACDAQSTQAECQESIAALNAIAQKHAESEKAMKDQIDSLQKEKQGLLASIEEKNAALDALVKDLADPEKLKASLMRSLETSMGKTLKDYEAAAAVVKGLDVKIAETMVALDAKTSAANSCVQKTVTACASAEEEKTIVEQSLVRLQSAKANAQLTVDSHKRSLQSSYRTYHAFTLANDVSGTSLLTADQIRSIEAIVI